MLLRSAICKAKGGVGAKAKGRLRGLIVMFVLLLGFEKERCV
jgi:hypothetical protein